MNIKTMTLAGIVVGMFAAPAYAHHSFAMFDHAKTSKLTGTIKEFEWINPHSWIHMVIADAAGKQITWSFEAGSTGQLTTAGWKREDIKPGDKIEIGFHPLKDGSFGGQVLTVVTAGGKTLCQGNECPGREGRE
jgi:hypothetical protein